MPRFLGRLDHVVNREEARGLDVVLCAFWPRRKVPQFGQPPSLRAIAPPFQGPKYEFYFARRERDRMRAGVDVDTFFDYLKDLGLYLWFSKNGRYYVSTVDGSPHIPLDQQRRWTC